MSQSRPEGPPSSVASESVEQTASTRVAINSDDPAWSHCYCPDPKKKHSIVCNYCKKTINAGITRVKYHLARLGGYNVAKCDKVPTDVKEEMLALITKKTSVKEQKQKARDEIDLDRSDGEMCSEDSNHGNEVIVLRSTKGPSCSAVASSGSGSIEKFYKPASIEETVQKNQKGANVNQKVQTKLTTQKKEERRDRACEYICQFFYEASIAHNTVLLPSFANMVEAIGAFGRGLRGPSPYEMSGPFLQKRKQKVLDGFKSHEESWKTSGCTLMTDAWTDKKGRGVMNLVVHSAHGVLFLDSVDCSAVKKNGKYIFDLVDRCIEDIGEENVVQVVTDNASVNVAAASLLAAKRPKIFWNGCAAHCLDLMLEDIGRLQPVQETIASARQLTAFLYAHTRVLDLMRKYLGKDLVRSGVTRFATAYLNLKSLQDNKKELERLFRDNDLNEMGYLKSAKGKKAEKVIKSEIFWKNVDSAVNFFEPLANVLRRMDSDVPAMGFLHGYMIQAKKEIALRFDNDQTRYKPVWEIIDKRWDSKLKSPLHLAGYYLNHYYYYPNKADIENDSSFRAAVIECVTTLIDDEEIQDNIIEDLSKYKEQQGSFGHDIATRQRRNKDFNPATWWLNHGTTTPNLRLLAIKILSLTCSSSGCERNWSVFEQVHTKRRNRLLHERMRDLVFVKFNSKLRHKKENKSRDPIEKEINDVLEDDNNEFITGLEPNANQSQKDQGRAETSAKAQEGASQGASASQAKAKRKRHVRHRKKLRTVASLMKPQSAASTSDSEENQDAMLSTDTEDD